VISAACERAVVSRATYYRRRDSDQEFARAVVDAFEDFADGLELTAVKRAKRKSDALLIFLLKGAKPEKYRARSDIEFREGQKKGIIEELVDRETQGQRPSSAPGSEQT
jgi:hypothetical protein